MVEDDAEGDLLPARVTPAALTLLEERDDAELQEYLDAAQSKATKDLYDKAWKAFVAWCAKDARCALPASPRTVAAYCRYLAKRSDTTVEPPLLPVRPSTIDVYKSAISHQHEKGGYGGLFNPARHPRVLQAMKGIRKKHGTRRNKKDPVTLALLQQLVDSQPGDLRGLRNKALILMAFAGAFRRSEVVALTVENVKERPEGLLVLVERSKTDQEGEGVQIVIRRAETSLCAAVAYGRWLEASGINTGPIFRAIDRHGNIRERGLSDKSVAYLLKGALKMLGMSEGARKGYAGHSFRRGFATEAARLGKQEREIMRHTRHESLTIMRGYIDDGEVQRSTVTDILGQGRKA